MHATSNVLAVTLLAIQLGPTLAAPLRSQSAPPTAVSEDYIETLASGSVDVEARGVAIFGTPFPDHEPIPRIFG